MSEKIKKITDIVTIVGPALIAAAGVISKTCETFTSAGVEIAMIALGALSSIASVVYNVADKKNGGEESDEGQGKPVA